MIYSVMVYWKASAYVSHIIKYFFPLNKQSSLLQKKHFSWIVCNFTIFWVLLDITTRTTIWFNLNWSITVNCKTPEKPVWQVKVYFLSFQKSLWKMSKEFVRAAKFAWLALFLQTFFFRERKFIIFSTPLSCK